MIENFDARAFRRDLHKNPELAGDVPRTAARVADLLERAGLTVTRNIGGHGVVASIGEGPPETALLFRADMDALPIQEANTFDHASALPGRHHGCGHDGHTTMLVAAALNLAARPPDRQVHLMFQPDEENGNGADAMLRDGLLDRFPAAQAFALHVMPGLGHGTIATAPGPFCAFEENFEIVLRGRGGHASMPERLADPLVAGAALVGALQTIVSRHCDPGAHAVFSVTGFETDGARNVVPSTVRITGDFRGYTDAIAASIRDALDRIARGVASAHGVSPDISVARSFSPLTNAPAQVESACRAARHAGLTVQDTYPSCGFSEDFATILAHVPGAFLLIGQGETARPLHDPAFDFDDDLLASGARFWEELARL